MHRLVHIKYNIRVRQICMQVLSLLAESSQYCNYTKLLSAFSIPLLLLPPCLSTWIPRTCSFHIPNTNTSSLWTGQLYSSFRIHLISSEMSPRTNINQTTPNKLMCLWSLYFKKLLYVNVCVISLKFKNYLCILSMYLN